MDRFTVSWRTAGFVASLAIMPGSCVDREAGATDVTPMTGAVAAYEDRTPMPGDACRPLAATLDGATLGPGVYCFDNSALLTGVLTLDGPADAAWDFQVGTGGFGALIGKGLTVALRGGARPCDVTWWVADDVTLNGSVFQGTLLAGGPITMVGGRFVGHTWSKGEVTVTGTVVTACAGPRLAEWHPVQSCLQDLGNIPEECIPPSIATQDRLHANETGDGTGYAGRR